MEEIRLQKNACAILEESRNYIIKEEYDKVLQLFLENGFTDFQKKLSHRNILCLNYRQKDNLL